MYWSTVAEVNQTAPSRAATRSSVPSTRRCHFTSPVSGSTAVTRVPAPEDGATA